MSLDRRTLLQLGLGGLVGLGLPGRARAAPTDKKFLFVYNRGGWDTTRVFTPMIDTSSDMGDGAREAEAAGLTFVDSPERPAVAAFFEEWGHRACVINGLEVQSITHERCRQLILTGRSDQDSDDWAATLAAHGQSDLVMPHLVLSGPSFSSRHSSRVVRVGSQGQLPDLLDGSAMAAADMSTAPPAGEGAVDAWLADRVERFSAAAEARGHDHAAAFGDAYGRALSDLDALIRDADDLDLRALQADCSRDIQSDMATAFDCFAAGLSRCAMVQYNGWCAQGWDTHQRPELQSWNFEELFGHLSQMMETLASHPGQGAGALADEVVVCVLSEMGRHPRANPWGGKDHWTYTSVMLLGAGIEGGQVIGAFDDDARGQPVDLQTGELRADGASLLPSHLGATLMRLGGEDDSSEEVIEAALS